MIGKRIEFVRKKIVAGETEESLHSAKVLDKTIYNGSTYYLVMLDSGEITSVFPDNIKQIHE